MIFCYCGRCGDTYETDSWSAPWLCRHCDNGIALHDPLGFGWATSG